MPVQSPSSAFRFLNEMADAVPWLVDGVVIGVGAVMSAQIDERIDSAVPTQ